MTRDLIYAAKSTKDPRGSIGTQVAQCAEAIRAEGREPYGRPYRDEAASAYHGNRGADLAAVMAEAERLRAAGDEVNLWVQHSDRTARGDGVEARHVVEVMLWALKQGVQVHSLQDAATFQDLLYSVVTGQRNHEDSARKAKATADGHARRRAKGGYHGGPEPFGLSYPRDEGGRTQPWLALVHSQHAPTVARMGRLVLDGKGINAVARILNAEGVPTAQAGKRWHGGTVRRIVTNPIYAGMAKDGTKLAHRPIIGPEDFARIQLLLAGRARAGSDRGGRRTSQPALFTNGHLRCGRCGGAMGYRSKPNRRSTWERYVCTEHEHAAERCAQMPVPVRGLETAVLEAFMRRAASRSATLADWQAVHAADLAHVSSLREDAERQAAKAAAAVGRVKADYTSGEITAAEWRELRGELTEAQTAADAQVARLGAREAEVAVRADSGVHDAFTEAMQALGHAADQALRHELPMEGVREALRRLFPSPSWHEADGRAWVQLGEPAPEVVALLVDDELEGAAGAPILDRLAASSTTGALGLTSAPVVAPIQVELER